MRMLFLFIFFYSITVFPQGQGDHSHHDVKSNIDSPKQEENISDVFEGINGAYLKNIKPIFLKKCFDCHSTKTQYPWYHAVPGVRQIIESDIAEGTKHLDLSDDFPFGGHGTPSEDLEAIGNAVVKNKMPPISYRLMHWDAQFSAVEKTTVLMWIQDSQKAMGQLNSDGPCLPTQKSCNTH